jgi:hypothetical protein
MLVANCIKILLAVESQQFQIRSYRLSSSGNTVAAKGVAPQIVWASYAQCFLHSVPGPILALCEASLPLIFRVKRSRGKAFPDTARNLGHAV